MAEVKKVIFVALGFPNIEKRRFLYSSLMMEFQRRGHDVFVIAADDDRKHPEIVVEKGIKILRVPSLNLFVKSKLLKGISNVLLPYLYKRALIKHRIKLDFDLILMPTPPITLIDVVLWIKKKSKGKLYLILRDIFPQNAVDLKMMNPNSFIHSFFRKKEVKLYEASDKIGCMSQANIDFVKKNNPELDTGKLHLLPNWADLDEIDEVDLNATKQQYGLQDKIVAIFGGNMGKPQKLENIVNLAKKCQGIEDLVFFLVGKGTEKERIFKMVKDFGLKNIILRDSLPKNEYNNILRIADIGLISLSEDFTIPNYPSKVLAYYQFKKPVLASVDLNTDFGIMQEKIKCGYWSEAGNVEVFKENLLKLYHNKKLREELGKNGYNYLKSHLTTEIAYETIMENI